jgi:hypothetical protein
MHEVEERGDVLLEKVVTSLQADRTCDARLHVTSIFFDIRVS